MEILEILKGAFIFYIIFCIIVTEFLVWIAYKHYQEKKRIKENMRKYFFRTYSLDRRRE